MSEVMRGVLLMPPSLWSGEPLDVQQRHSVYRAAAARIDALEAEVEMLRAALAQQAEPVAWMVTNDDGQDAYVTADMELHDLRQACREGWRYAAELEDERKRLTAALAQQAEPVREWQGLTEEEINELPEVKGVWWPASVSAAVLRAIRAADAKLKERNT
jgi:hypothetical protein